MRWGVMDLLKIEMQNRDSNIYDCVRWRSGGSLRVTDDVDVNHARPGTVELAQIDTLPPTQNQSTLLDDHSYTVTDDAGACVSGGVALVVLVVGLHPRHHPFQIGQHVATNRRIGVLVDRDSRRCVGDIDDDMAAPDLAAGDHCFDLRSNLVQFLMCLSLDAKRDYMECLPDMFRSYRRKFMARGRRRG